MGDPQVVFDTYSFDRAEEEIDEFFQGRSEIERRQVLLFRFISEVLLHAPETPEEEFGKFLVKTDQPSVERAVNEITTTITNRFKDALKASGRSRDRALPPGVSREDLTDPVDMVPRKYFRGLAEALRDIMAPATEYPLVRTILATLNRVEGSGDILFVDREMFEGLLATIVVPDPVMNERGYTVDDRFRRVMQAARQMADAAKKDIQQWRVRQSEDLDLGQLAQDLQGIRGATGVDGVGWGTIQEEMKYRLLGAASAALLNMAFSFLEETRGRERMRRLQEDEATYRTDTLKGQAFVQFVASFKPDIGPKIPTEKERRQIEHRKTAAARRVFRAYGWGT